MTENKKRFIALGSTHLKDTETGEEFYAPCEWELLDLLNALHEENEALKQILKNLEECGDDCPIQVMIE